MLIHNTDGDGYGGVVVIASRIGDVGVGAGVGDVGGVGVCAGVGDVGRGGFQFLLLLVSGGLVAAKERSCQGKTWLMETLQIMKCTWEITEKSNDHLILKAL